MVRFRRRRSGNWRGILRLAGAIVVGVLVPMLFLMAGVISWNREGANGLSGFLICLGVVWFIAVGFLARYRD